jgi:hypothetical protein
VLHRRDKNISCAMPHMPVAHCISEDRAQTKGIAKDICEICPENRNVEFVPMGCVSMTRTSNHVVFNLVTKEKFYQKPKYETLKKCLIHLREHLVNDPLITKIAIPELGCGLDLLRWERVLPMLKQALQGLPIDIYIYKT